MLERFTANVTEYTFEINPETFTEEKADLLHRYGVNRISIGLQSSDKRLLKLMNRHHDLDDVRKTIEFLRDRGIENISLDVLYSLPTQTMEDLEKTLNDVLELRVPHVSLYSLTVEKGTAFDRLGYKPLDSDIEADMYEYIVRTLTENGYIQYEIANFALEGHESKHNLAYWNYDDYRGLSCGSVGKYGHRRYTVTSDLKRYLDTADCVEIEELSNEEEAFENIMMSLRTVYGLDLEVFRNRYGIDFRQRYSEAIEKNSDHLIFKDGHCICVNREILNTVLVDFM